ncbi:TIGR01621 family pseudouridine synthase [Chitinivorax sp. B]|uniref:TIGR01621 family pseudouridine synthase n=1 Tax=Chitinivorax sp. B TaxID=2502235 RepID=UPI0010F959C7|nr:TIGR01621 family pseudouridine synthase [Chitinivorax sp. B]
MKTQIVNSTPAFNIVFDDVHLLVVDKAPGIEFHRQSDQQSLIDRIRAECGLQTLFPVHRLDKVTSGLVIFAKSQAVASELGWQFETGQIEKYYLALSDRAPRKKQGLIKGDMQKGRGGAWRLSSSVENPAITQFFSYSLQPGLRLFLLRPRTGKTHQLRVAMKSLGAPILGDTLYGGKMEAVDRVYLHAYTLRLMLSGQPYLLQARPNVGGYFQLMNDNKLESLLNPWALPWPRI